MPKKEKFNFVSDTTREGFHFNYLALEVLCVCVCVCVRVGSVFKEHWKHMSGA